MEESESYFKALKTFLTSIMNDQDAYLIDKKITAAADEALRKLLKSVAHKELIYFVIDSEARDGWATLQALRKIRFFNF